MMIIIANFRLHYECNIKYEYDFKANQLSHQNSHFSPLVTST